LYPCPILYLLPTETLAKGTSKRRITPAIIANKRLHNKITNGRSKTDAGTVFHKEVAGGGITFAWSNSTASLRSFSARTLILDDIDGYGEFGEGNVVELAKARTDAMSNRMIYINSTPTISGYSLIEKEFEESDQRHYFMPCPHCGELIEFEWENFHFEHEDYNLVGDVTYICKHCGGVIHEYHKTKMMDYRNGAKWIPTKKHHIHGYYLPSFYSPVGWLSWNEIVRKFLKAKKSLDRGDHGLMQVWVNTRLARPYQMKLDGVDITNPKERVEPYGCDVPNDVLIITAGIDTQDDRVEVAVLGHGKSGEIWFIDYHVIAGDIKYQKTRDALDDFLNNTEYERCDGNRMKIFAKAQDTGGHRTKAVYEYLKNKLPNRMFGIKGSNTKNAPLVNRTVYNLPSDAKNLFIIGVNSIKDDFYSRLEVKEAGPNFVHFPDKDVFDERFFKGLTAEKRDENGKYVKIRTRNEPIDCTVYAIAALLIMDIVVDQLDNPILSIGDVKKDKKKKKDVIIEDRLDDYLDEY
jgi:phage terminase large subunit GpA-like protein